MGEEVKIGLDITGLAHARRFAGIERVDTEFHKHFSKFLDSSKYDLVPIYTVAGDPDLNELHPNIAPSEMFLKPVSDISECKIIFLAFLNASIPFKRILELKKNNNLKVVSTIHDIMPIKNPEWFPTPDDSPESKFKLQPKKLFQLYLQMTLSLADIIIVPSHQVKSDIEKLGWRYLARMEVIPLGAYDKSLNQIPRKHQDFVNCIYLSTVEPRKAHSQLIEAFEILWAKQVDIRLNIVGNKGWLIDDLVELISNHEEFNKRLFWHKGLSDEKVNEIYSQSQIAFAVSFDEGFGLNIEEALVRGLKVIARDIPVFRERQQENLYFFDGGAKALSEKIVEVSNLATSHSTKNSNRTMEDFTLDIIKMLHLI